MDIMEPMGRMPPAKEVAMNLKCVREYRSIIEQAGASVLSVEDGGKHIKFRCKAKNREFLYVCSRSASDRRHFVTIKCDIRRIVRGA
jgi:hypothetical protein